MKQAVILAAGRGSRLQRGVPKCLVDVAGVTLIQRQLDVLHALGINRICVVVGHRADDVRDAVGSGCDYVVNERYAETNSLYSLWLVREWVKAPFVMMNCDVLAHPDVYHRVLAANGSALAFDSTSGDEDEHMKVALQGPFLRAMSKTMDADQVDGENVGIIQFSEKATSMLFRECGTLIDRGGDGTWAPAAVDRLARRVAVRAIDVHDLPWTEIDFPADLRHAEDATWPAIDAGRLASATPAAVHAHGTNGTGGHHSGHANGTNGANGLNGVADAKRRSGTKTG